MLPLKCFEIWNVLKICLWNGISCILTALFEPCEVFETQSSAPPKNVPPGATTPFVRLPTRPRESTEMELHPMTYNMLIFSAESFQGPPKSTGPWGQGQIDPSALPSRWPRLLVMHGTIVLYCLTNNRLVQSSHLLHDVRPILSVYDTTITVTATQDFNWKKSQVCIIWPTYIMSLKFPQGDSEWGQSPSQLSFDRNWEWIIQLF